MDRFPISEPGREHRQQASTAIWQLPELWRDYEYAAEALAGPAEDILEDQGHILEQRADKPIPLDTAKSPGGLTYWATVTDAPFKYVQHSAVAEHSMFGDEVTHAVFHLQNDDRHCAEITVNKDADGFQTYELTQAGAPAELALAVPTPLSPAAAMEILTDIALQAGANPDDPDSVATLENICTSLTIAAPAVTSRKTGRYSLNPDQLLPPFTSAVQLQRTVSASQRRILLRQTSIELATQQEISIDPVVTMASGLAVVLTDSRPHVYDPDFSRKKPFRVDDSAAAAASLRSKFARQRDHSVEAQANATLTLPEGAAMPVDIRNSLLDAAIEPVRSLDSTISVLRCHLGKLAVPAERPAA